MRNALLDKARAILAHPKQESSVKGATLEAEENKAPMTEPMVPAVTPGGNAPPYAAPALKNIEVQPAASNARPIYWETGDGRILGPAVPEFLARDGETFWISTIFEGQIWWINADRLRSRKAFEGQEKPKTVELVKEPR